MFRSVSSLLYCLVIFYLAVGTHAMTPEQNAKIHEHFEKIGMECLKETKIDEQDIANLRGRKPVTGANTPCFLACMFRMTGVLDNEGMLQKETALEKLKAVFEDPEEQKSAEDFLHMCSAVNSVAVSDGPKGCERSQKAYTCMIENAAQFGIDL